MSDIYFLSLGMITIIIVVSSVVIFVATIVHEGIYCDLIT
jgi:hypothetical protein